MPSQLTFSRVQMVETTSHNTMTHSLVARSKSTNVGENVTFPPSMGTHQYRIVK